MTSYLTQHDQHTLQVQRFATKLLNAEIYPSLSEAYRAARLILLDQEQITSISQLNKITREITKAVEAAQIPAWQAVTKELDGFAVYDSNYYANLISTTAGVALSVPADEKILSYINKSLMSLQSGNRVSAGLWGEFVKDSIGNVAETYNDAVKASFANNETIGQAVKRIKTATDGILQHDAEALARTGVQHYAVRARQAMAKDNANVIEREVPIVTFDNRTSFRCLGIGSKYGKKGWPVGEAPQGYPPYHFNCRTTLGYLVKGQKELEGNRAAVGGKKGEVAKDAFEGRKDRKRKPGKVKRRGRQDDKFFDPGQVKATTQIDKWVRNQPIWFQESLLGKTRAELFRKGKMRLSKFTDATGEQLTIDELRAVDSKAFKMAGLG